MKKALTILLVLMLGTMMAFAGGKKESNEAAAETENGVVEITYWDNNASPIRTEIFTNLIAEFEAENPDIKVNFVPVPNSEAKSKYSLAVQSHTAPDCGIITQTWMSDFIVQKGLLALDDYIAEWDGSQYLLDLAQESIRMMDPNGKTYGMAFSQTLPAVWYNTKMFEEAGMEIPDDWMSIFDAAYKLTDKSKGQYGFALRGGAGSSQQLEQMLYMYSGIATSFDENGNATINAPEHVEFLEAFADLYMNATAESDITNGVNEMIAEFDSGSAAIMFHNLGSYGQHADTLGPENFTALSAVKSLEDTEVIVSNGATCNVIFADSKHPEEAFRWISFVNSHEATSYFNREIGQIPTNTQALQDEWVADIPQMKQAADALLSGNCVLVTLPFNMPGWADLHTNFAERGLQEVILGQRDAKEFLDSWAAQLTQLNKNYQLYMQSQQ